MKLTAVPRITLGLVSLAVVLLMGFDMVLKLFPSDADATRDVRDARGQQPGHPGRSLVAGL
jgi:hypothetical protein